MIAHHPPGKQAVQKVLGQHMGETPSLDMGRQGRLPGRKRWPFGDNQRVSREKEGPLCQCEHHRELTWLLQQWPPHPKDKNHPGPHLLRKS